MKSLQAVNGYDTCRAKRNTVEYDMVGGVTTSEVEELVEPTHNLQGDVVSCLRATHPDLAPA
jgi:hypothetical protein